MTKHSGFLNISGLQQSENGNCRKDVVKDLMFWVYTLPIMILTRIYFVAITCNKQPLSSLGEVKKITWFWSARASLLSSASLLFFICKNFIFYQKNNVDDLKYVKLHSFFKNTFDNIPLRRGCVQLSSSKYKEGQDLTTRKVKTLLVEDLKRVSSFSI